MTDLQRVSSCRVPKDIDLKGRRGGRKKAIVTREARKEASAKDDMAEQQDVEMTEPEVVHPLQIKFEDAEDLVAAFTTSSKPDQAIQIYQEILSYQGTSIGKIAVVECLWTGCLRTTAPWKALHTKSSWKRIAIANGILI